LIESAMFNLPVALSSIGMASQSAYGITDRIGAASRTSVPKISRR